MFLCGAGLLPLDCGLSGLLTVNAIFFITVAGPKPIHLHGDWGHASPSMACMSLGERAQV